VVTETFSRNDFMGEGVVFLNRIVKNFHQSAHQMHRRTLLGFNPTVGYCNLNKLSKEASVWHPLGRGTSNMCVWIACKPVRWILGFTFLRLTLIGLSPQALAVTPTPMAMPTLAATTPIPKVLPTMSPPFWVTKEPFVVQIGNMVRNVAPQKVAVDLVESEKDEQFALLAPQSHALGAGQALYQRRFNSEGRFSLHHFAADRGAASDLLSRMPQVFGAAVHCPLTEEVIFQAPPMDDSGKFLVNSKPSRVYLFSLKTGKTELIWRRPRDQFGTFVSKMSASPDCMHILVNQALENKGNKTPFGELVYVKRPMPLVGKKVTVAQEWTSNVLHTLPTNGVWKGYSEAMFVLPRDPARYVESHIPPKVFAITAMINQDKNLPLMNLFVPDTKRKIVTADAVAWARERSEAAAETGELSNPTLDDSGVQVFLLWKGKRDENSAVKTGIVSLDLQNFDGKMRWHVRAERLELLSFDVRPKGDAIVFEFLETPEKLDLETLADKKISGLGLITWDAQSPRWQTLVRLMPSHNLEAHHQPTPRFTYDGTELFYIEANIGELLEAALYLSKPALLKELQFGGKLKKWQAADLGLN
jgi:hypothetical protein